MAALMKNDFRSRATPIALVTLLGAIGVAAPAHAAEPTAGQCLEASDKWIALRNQRLFVEARAELLVCASTSCPAEVRDECAARIGEVNASIPTVVFEAKDAGGRDLSAVKVTMDGTPLTEELKGASIPVDPGEHSFVFEAQGFPSVQSKIIVAEGVKDRHEVVRFGSSESAAPSARGAPPAGDSRQDHPPASDDGKTQRILGFTALGAGAIGFAVGVIFEIQRSNKLSDRDAICPNGDCSVKTKAEQDALSPQVQSLTDDARSASTVGAIGLVAGGVLVAGGLALIFTAPNQEGSEHHVAVLPMVGPHVQGLAVTGSLW
jgi:hypothetical protein